MFYSRAWLFLVRKIVETAPSLGEGGPFGWKRSTPAESRSRFTGQMCCDSRGSFLDVSYYCIFFGSVFFSFLFYSTGMFEMFFSCFFHHFRPDYFPFSLMILILSVITCKQVKDVTDFKCVLNMNLQINLPYVRPPIVEKEKLPLTCCLSQLFWCLRFPRSKYVFSDRIMIYDTFIWQKPKMTSQRVHTHVHIMKAQQCEWPNLTLASPSFENFLHT